MKNILLAGIRERFVAQIINYGLLMLIALPVGLIPEGSELNSLRSIELIVILLYSGIQLYLLTRFGQSIGKRIMKVRIVDEKTGGRASFEQVIFYRGIVMGFLVGIPGLSVINLIMIFRRDRKCLHDFLASTLVVKA